MVKLYIYSGIRSPRQTYGKIGIVYEINDGEGKPVILQRFDLNRNQAEMLALYIGLQMTDQAGGTGKTEIFTDSDYVFGTLTRFLPKWEQEGWKNSKGEPVKNGQAWARISQLLKGRDYEVRLKEKHTYETWLIDNTKREEDKKWVYGKSSESSIQQQK